MSLVQHVDGFYPALDDAGTMISRKMEQALSFISTMPIPASAVMVPCQFSDGAAFRKTP